MKIIKNTQGFAALESLLIVLVIAIIGFTGWYVYHHKHLTKQAPQQSSSSSPKTSTPAAGTPTPTEPTLSYHSASEKATFHYPGTWTTAKPSAEGNGDSIGLKSPDGKVIVSWVAQLGGIGGNCNADIPLGSSAEGTPACASTTVVSSTPISGAPGLYVVSGYSTQDGKTFYPWIAAQTKDGLRSGREIGYEAYQRPMDDFSNLFAIGGLGKGAPAPSFSTADQAKAFLQTDDAKQAQQIIASLQY